MQIGVQSGIVQFVRPALVVTATFQNNGDGTESSKAHKKAEIDASSPFEWDSAGDPSMLTWYDGNTAFGIYGTEI